MFWLKRYVWCGWLGGILNLWGPKFWTLEFWIIVVPVVFLQVWGARPGVPKKPKRPKDAIDCDQCGGSGEDGFDRSYPPDPYMCEKCDGNGWFLESKIIYE